MVSSTLRKKKMMTINVPLALPSSNNYRNKPFSCWFEIHDPKSKFVNNCNRFFIFVGLYCLYIDPYFLYLSTINDSGSVNVNLRFGVCIALFRLIGDLFLLLGVVLRFRIGYEDPTVHIFGNRKLVNDAKLIALKYLKSSFIFDLLAALPLPQVYLGYEILLLKSTEPTELYYNLIVIVFMQSYMRIIATIIAYMKIEKTTGIAITNPWSGTLYILFVYGMLSHFLGASYYDMYIMELQNCIEWVSHTLPNATMHGFDQLIDKCSQKEIINLEGLLSDAFENNIGSRSFTQRFMFCFSWGLKTLSSMGQNLNSSVLLLDTFINLVIVIFGLLVFADLIARMQTCMQLAGEREEQQMMRHRELEEWTNFHQLPTYLRNLVQQTMQCQLHASRGMSNEAILDSLPMDLRCEIRKHLYMEHVRKLPAFEEMDDQLLRAICGHLRTFTCAEGMFIVLEGDPVQQVLFIVSGELEIFSINGGSSGCTTVGQGGIYGQELLEWSSSLDTSTHNLPSSTCTVKCLTDVEAFSLRAKDLKLLAIMFNYDQNFFDALMHHSSAHL